MKYKQVAANVSVELHSDIKKNAANEGISIGAAIIESLYMRGYISKKNYNDYKKEQGK